MGEVRQFVHRRLAMREEKGQHVAVRRRERLQPCRRQFANEPSVLRFVNPRYEFAYLVHDDAQYIIRHLTMSSVYYGV